MSQHSFIALLLLPMAAAFTVKSIFSVPGNPISMSVVLINTAAPSGLYLQSKTISAGGGTFSSAPAASIPLYGSRQYNYGFTLAANKSTGVSKATVIYAANNTETNQPGQAPYAVLALFARDPTQPGTFGLEVNSNTHANTITVYQGLFGDSDSTTATFFVHIDPPKELFQKKKPFAIPTIPIAPEILLPLVSLGTGSGQKGNVTNATLLWLEAGGIAFDTAYDYQDQKNIATALAFQNVQSSEIFITTKVPCGKYNEAKQHIADNLKQLNVKYVDLLLIHSDHPFSPPFDCDIAATWKALEEAKEDGTAKAIGVSHFSIAEMELLSSKPSVNQCSLSIKFHDDVTIEYCKKMGITYMSFSPLCGGANGSSCDHGSVLTVPEVIAVAKSHHVQPAQVALKWIVQQGLPLTTASWREDYMVEDLDLWSWGNLTVKEMETLSAVQAQNR